MFQSYIFPLFSCQLWLFRTFHGHLRKYVFSASITTTFM